MMTKQPLDLVRMIPRGGLSVGGALTSWYRSNNTPMPIAVYEPFSASTLAASYVNVVNPGVHDAAAPVAAPTFIAGSGWSFNGTQYLTTDIIPAAGWTLLMHCGDTYVTNKTLCGCSKTGGPWFTLNAFQGANKVAYGNGGSLLQVAPQMDYAGTLTAAGLTGYRNGIADAGSIPAWSGTMPYEFWIGTNHLDGSVANSATGGILAIAIWNSVLDSAQVLSVHNALQRAIGLNLIICDGDSRTSGAGSTGGQSYPVQLREMLGYKNTFRNYGVGGQTQTDMNADAATQIDTKYSTSYGRNAVIAWGGVNDLGQGRSAANTYSSISTYVSGRKAAGFKVVVGTIPTCIFTGTAQEKIDKEAQRVALNSLIMANAAGADAVSDVASAAELQNPSDATYYSDYVHFTNAGYAVVAREFNNPVLSLL
jgi:lysophospholipase L1-like esterase